MFIFPYVSACYAQFEKNAHERFLKRQQTAYPLRPAAFVIVQQAHLPATVRFKRELSPGYFVIPSSDATEGILGDANDLWKLSPSLFDSVTKENTSYFSGLDRVLVRTFDRSELEKFLTSNRIAIVDKPVNSNVFVIRITSREGFDLILGNPLVTFIDRERHRANEETLNSFHDLGPNRINIIHDEYPGINGSGLTISIRERTIDKSDIDLKGRIIETSFEDPLISLHANQMATIISGGGNSSEQSRGVTWASAVTSASFTSAFPDPLAYFNDHEISVQNHSYGFGVENYYGAEAEAFDNQCNENSSLLHVFSSGNQGEVTPSDGAYAGIVGYSNLTGNMKMSKNAVVVGGHYADLTIDTRNSRGPAYDGRLKPEVVAFGPEGTSDAAAYASGVGLLLQQQHKSAFGVLPPSALVRLIIAASADDVGSPGPDFITGFGALNAQRALEWIISGQVMVSEIEASRSDTWTIQVFEGMERLRIAIAWNDPAAPAGSVRALINDLDLEVVDPDGETWLPWVLNSFPHIDSLSEPATRGRDSINNIEYITIHDPVPGTYRIQVSAQDIEGVQEYVAAYWMEEESSFLWSYPGTVSKIATDEDAFVRWTTSFAGHGILEVNVNGGDFAPIGETPLHQMHAVWRTPAEPGFAIFRMKIEDRYFLSDTLRFSVPMTFNTGFSCDQEGMLQWNRIPEASQYIVYNLGDQYMQPVAQTSDSLFFFEIDRDGLNPFFAVSAVANGSPGIRSLTYDFRNLGASCYYRSFSAQSTPSGDALLTLQLSTLFNVESIRFERKQGASFEFIGEVPVSSQAQVTFLDTDVRGGLIIYRAIIHLLDGTMVTSDEAQLIYADNGTFQVFPNPLPKETENLRIISDGDDVVFEIIDASGRTIRSQPLAGILFQMNFSAFPDGIYFYRFLRKDKVTASGRILLR